MTIATIWHLKAILVRLFIEATHMCRTCENSSNIFLINLNLKLSLKKHFLKVWVFMFSLTNHWFFQAGAISVMGTLFGKGSSMPGGPWVRLLWINFISKLDLLKLYSRCSLMRPLWTQLLLNFWLQTLSWSH